MKRSALIVFALLASLAASAKITVKQPCSDGMVLQQKAECAVWGHANPGATVSVKTSWDGRSYSVKTDSKGIWKASVKTPAASYKKYSIKVSGDGSSLTINDVLVGEVWLASGQSNMEMPINGFDNCPVEGAADVISGPSLKDKVRMITIKIYQPLEPIDDVHETDGWLDAVSENVGGMSATAFFFARKVQEALDVPVGIVTFPRGGAAVESWLPKETLAAWGDDVSVEAVNAQNEWSRSYVNYNGMQHPIQGYTAKGFIWYQGCTNVGRAEQFEPRMTELIRQWREVDWGDTARKMPFYMCEIAPYQYDGGQYGQAAALRQAQHETAKHVENCEIIVTNDLVYSYEKTNIHPSQKRQVGERLAYLALNRDYGFSKIACYAPEAVKATNMKASPSQWYPMAGSSMVMVEIANCPHGINRLSEIEGLEVRAANGVFVPITEAYFDTMHSALLINCGKIYNPTEIRYGWGDFKPGNLKSVEGLPFAPFNLKIQ